MKHIIVGGDGFVGRHLARDLVDRGEEVIVADIARGSPELYREATFIDLDVADWDAVRRLPIGSDDVVYNLAARMLSPLQPRSKRIAYFWPVNLGGAHNVMRAMLERGASNLVQFTTDMVYGHAQPTRQNEHHPTRPLGEYGKSKLEVERLVRSYRSAGMSISVFRPRLIVGPNRLGILEKLFYLVERNLPVPMIGSGRNRYQFVSVFDCASACVRAWEARFPNAEYNLGSDDPPPVRVLLEHLIKAAGSRSFLLPVPASLAKAALSICDHLERPLMDPEQYLIADESCVRDTTRAKTELGWRPQFNDIDMLLAAYRNYRSSRGLESHAAVGQRVPLPPTSP